MNGWLGCLFLFWCVGYVTTSLAIGQVEMSGWGELRGIRVDGELVEFSTKITVVGRDWQGLAQTAHWRTQEQSYAREGRRLVTSGKIVGIPDVPPLRFKQTARDIDARTAELEIELTTETAMDIEGVYLFVGVSAKRFGTGSATLIGAADPAAPIPFSSTAPSNKHLGFGDARGIRLTGARRRVELDWGKVPRRIVIRDDREAESDQITAFVPIHLGSIKAGQVIRQTYTIRVEAEVDRAPATIRIDTPEHPGTWEGIGGNFCWGTQSKTVPFYLDHLRVAWARVSFPWHHWQADEHADPLTLPLEKQHEEVRECIRIARELHRRDIPMMLAAWNAPGWAQLPREAGEGTAQQFGRTVRLDPSKREQIAQSITAYLLFFKQEVGQEPAHFSFNEPNLGINVLQSPQDHADDIKLLGDAFARAGLNTKLLLGDANEPRAVDFISLAINDPQAMKHVSAVSYHSWNDGTDAQLRAWGDHARRAGVPLYVAEAGHDPDAHRYRAILDEAWYAIDEAELNLRCINLSGAATIMHWQLTPDYGLITEEEGAPAGFRLSTRWFAYSQLDRFTPRGAQILHAKADADGITAAALASDAGMVVHLTNTQARRTVTITGLPSGSTTAIAYVTDATRHQSPMPPLMVQNGTLEVSVPSQSMVSVQVASP